MGKIDILAKVAEKAPTLAPKIGRLGLTLQKASPEILFGVGVAAVVGGAVLACRSTMKIDSILDEAQEDLNKIKQGQELELDSYSEEDVVKDKAIVYTQTGFKLVKTYLPAVTTIGLGIACFAASHNIQHNRIAAIGAAYKIVENSFSKYRSRVVSELGVERDEDFYFGSKDMKVEVIELDEKTNKEKKFKKTVKAIDVDDGMYSFWFGPGNPNFENSAVHNMTFLKQHQNYFNDRLRLYGHVFLNEVLDTLGIARVPMGQLVGWVDKSDGDNFIDFDINDRFYDGRLGSEYVNGGAEPILLDFNVDGVVFEKI